MFTTFEILCQRLQFKKGKEISEVVRIRRNNGRGFEKSNFTELCSYKGISHEVSAPFTI